eukprot:673961-Rhodomonas_salina.1
MGLFDYGESLFDSLRERGTSPILDPGGSRGGQEEEEEEQQQQQKVVVQQKGGGGCEGGGGGGVMMIPQLTIFKSVFQSGGPAPSGG